MAYKAPIWEDGKSPAISAENLNALSQTAEGAQVLYGNSAPTSSTEGAVGQFYLVVVADSDGNYPLYQCVSIANGSYVWRDTRRIPDSITSMLGIPAPGTINSALNVLAHVGNLHVWQRVQTYSEPVPEVPAGYTFGSEQSVVAVGTSDGSSYYCTIYYADSVTVSSDGVVSLSNPSNQRNRIYDWNGSSTLAGKFCIMGEYDGSTNLVKPTENGGVVFYVPSGGTIAYNESTKQITISKYQSVTGYPYTPAIPAGTTTDYLTSTDRNAYPDQSAAGGQDAYYTLGDVVSGSFYIGSFFAGSNSAVQYMVSDTPFVDESGSVGISNGTTVTFSNSLGDPGTENNAIAKVKALFAGKYVMRTNDPETDSSTMYYTLLPKNEVVYIPDDISVSVLTAITGSPNSMALSKYQPVTGHAAIPANTTITYLGQLGGGARIEVGSYVGTGAYGSSNPNTLTFGFEPKMVAIFSPTNNGNYAYKLFMLRNVLGASVLASDGNNNGVIVTWSEKSVTWYLYGSKNVSRQMNGSGEIYNYIAIG